MPGPPCLVKFGLFEVDLQSGEVRKAGMRQKLAGQPVKVLQALLERPHEIVTRDELRHRLWPDNTFVDYELALKKAVNRLREVLGDSAESPRFIETIPRQGYRFISSVEVLQQAQPVPSNTTSASKTRITWALIGGLGAASATLLLGLKLAELRTHTFANSRPSDIRSIAVLPLQNLSNDPGQDYFSDGVTDALTTELAQIGTLRVISRTSAMHFKGTRETLPEIGRELNVDAIVEGSVVRSENRVRITAQLIDTRTDHHLWAKAYEQNLKDVLFMQDEVSRDIAAEIRVQLTPGERTRLAAARPVNPEAHEAYLKGRYFYEKLSVPDFRQALTYFQEAVKLDERYAPAYVGIASSYKELGNWGALSPTEVASHAREAVQKALALDQSSGEAHAVLGHIHFEWDWDWLAAEREYKRAFELGPASTDTRIQYAVYLSAMGRHDHALAIMEEARSLDPISKSSNGMLGTTYFWAHRFDQAVDQFHKSISLHLDSTLDHDYLGRCYERKGMYSEAVDEYLVAMSLNGVTREQLTPFRRGFVRSGIFGFKREELNSALDPSKAHYVNPFWIAQLYAGLGDKDRTFDWLEKAYQERNQGIAFLNTEPVFDSLRPDPRFQDLLTRLRLSQ